MPDKYREQTSPLNVQRIGGVTMAENPVSTRPPLARKPHRYKVDEGLDVRFLCHANSTHVLQTLWRGLPLERSSSELLVRGLFTEPPPELVVLDLKPSSNKSPDKRTSNRASLTSTETRSSTSSAQPLP